MSSDVAAVPADVTPAEYRSTSVPCPLCVMTRPLDDERPRTGTVRWKILSTARLKIGIAVHFECPDAHLSEDDPQLLKAFPSRLF